MENTAISEKVKRKFKNRCSSNNSCIYFLGFIGAATHFLCASNGFVAGLFGILKALVWPAILVYEAFQTLVQ